MLSVIPYTTVIALIEFGGSLIIVGYCLAACVTLLRTHDITQARLLVAEGALWGLNFKVAGSLLETITIHTWQQIAMFVVIFTLRTLIKRVFTWERGRLEQREGEDRSARPQAS